MTIETTTPLSPAEVLVHAREFFTARDSLHTASIETESDSHITFNTFRSRIAVSAFADPEEEDSTRVRVTTLREDATAAKFITYVRTAASSGRRRAGSPG